MGRWSGRIKRVTAATQRCTDRGIRTRRRAARQPNAGCSRRPASHAPTRAATESRSTWEALSPGEAGRESVLPWRQDTTSSEIKMMRPADDSVHWRGTRPYRGHSQTLRSSGERGGRRKEENLRPS